MENDNFSNQEFGLKEPIKNSTTVLVLGILSILGCFCYGFVGLILGIIAVVMASSGLKAYNENPERFNPAGLANLKAGRVCAIIGIALSVIYVISAIIVIILFGFEAILNPNPEMFDHNF
ncbi:CCC motif membrane protein [Aureivirga marina]|uniref:CCC motif membrane protein n=1 Tax=Aureivirga marina TaxID=1182451 RepID=UPI0018C9F091|nr:CCC motif membrane protein [Aureivirga marina]